MRKEENSRRERLSVHALFVKNSIEWVGARGEEAVCGVLSFEGDRIKMAQQTSFIPQYQQGNTMNQYPRSGNAFVVVDQQPIRSEVFPYSLPVKGILVFSIFKCIVGSLLFLAGIANVIVVRYEVKIAFGIWCGLTVST